MNIQCIAHTFELQIAQCLYTQATGGGHNNMNTCGNVQLLEKKTVRRGADFILWGWLKHLLVLM